MRVLLVGAGGLLGTAMQHAVPQGVDLVSLPKQELDITDRQAVAVTVERLRPEYVINCAGYTAVDQAEREPDLAHRVNAEGATHLAAATERARGTLVQLSTDYVFDGTREVPYREDDEPGPLSVYGRTKLAGEQAVRDLLPDRHLIVRAQWLFGAGGKNFVDTILRLASEQSTLRVVNDQRGRPTYARDLAAGIWKLVGRGIRGTVHVANDGTATWFDVAAVALAAAALRTRLEPCRTADMPRPAQRPAFSVLDCSRFEALTGERLPPWDAAVREYVSSRSSAFRVASTNDGG